MRWNQINNFFSSEIDSIIEEGNAPYAAIAHDCGKGRSEKKIETEREKNK